MIDIIYFIFAKMLAFIGLAIAFGGPAFVAYALIFGPTDPQGGAKSIRQGPGRIVYFSTVGVFLVTALIVYVSWAWPFGHQRSPSNNHITASMWHVLTDNMEEHNARWASPPKAVRTEDGTEVRRFILVTYNPPKHFYVTLKDVETGTVYESQYVSKHCNAHHNLVKGEQYNLQVRYFRLSDNPEKRYLEFTNLRNEFCGS